MSRTRKHPPKPDRFTKKHRTGAHQARIKRVVATIRELRLEREMPDWLWQSFLRKAGETLPLVLCVKGIPFQESHEMPKLPA